MGNECQNPCVYGTAQLDGTCKCDPCYTGPACNDVCTTQGSCVNDTCQCDLGFWGKLNSTFTRYLIYRTIALTHMDALLLLCEIHSFRYKDNSVYLHECSPFWVGIFITFKKDNHHVDCFM